MDQVLIIVRRDSEDAKAVADSLSEWLASHQYQSRMIENDGTKLSASDVKGVVLGVVIGGDGTFLGLVRKLEEKNKFPLLGVNLGSLGFITEISKNDVLKVVEGALGGKFSEEKRQLLRVDLCRGGETIESTTVFNDTALTKDARTPMLKFEVYCDGELFSRLGADGFLISTPTGSTAYGMSAGGPILHPAINGMVLNAICAHALTARPIVVPLETEVEIKLNVGHGKTYLTCDGQVSFEVKPGDRIKVSGSEMFVRLMKCAPNRWGEVLRSKLNMQ